MADDDESDVDQFDQDDEEPPQAAIRLTFRYDGNEVRLLGLTRIQKAVPPAQSAERDRLGSWTEVRDTNGRTLDRRSVTDPVRNDAEVFPETLGGPITRVAVDRPSGLFTVLVPDLEGAESLALMRSAATEQGRLVGPDEVIRVALNPEREPPRAEG